VSQQWGALPLAERHQLRLRRGDGSAFESEVSVHNIPVGGATGQAVIIRDVTLQRAAFEAMREAKAAAEQANRTKTQFMAGISHELRTPLGGIRGLTDLLAQQTLPNAARRYVNLIAQNTELLRDVIEDILDFAAIEAGRVTIDPVPVNLHEVVGDAFGCLAVRVADKPVRLCLSIDPQTPQRVVADPKRIRQIVLNLAGNAIKFTQQGEVSLRLSPIDEPLNPANHHASTPESNPPNDVSNGDAPMAWFEITVSDTGIGIAPENQSRIFDAFEQADRGTNKQFGGTGLGLAIARGLAQRMGGDITVTSKVGQGSRFQCALALPLDPKPTRDEKSLPATPPEGATAVVSVGNATMQDAIAETLLHCHWPIRTPSMLEPDRVHLHWILTDQTADAAFRIRARKSSDRVIWLTRAGEPTPRRAKREDAIVIEPLHPNELRRWLSGKPLLQSSRGQRKRRRGTKPSLPANHDRATPTLQTAAVAATSESHLSGSKQEHGSPEPAGYRLLVVDDSATNRLVIHDQLVAAGHHVQTADSGDAAVQRLGSNSFDCIMMDLQMPNMDGTEATRIIHQQFSKAGRTPPPIIALTAHVTDQHRQLCREAGMDGYITKPVDLELLLAEIERVMTASTVAESDAMLPPELPTNAPAGPSSKLSDTSDTAQPPSHRPADHPTEPTPDQEVWDWRSQLSKHCGNDPDTMDSVCDAFLMEVPSLLTNLAQGAKQGDANRLRSASHTLKSCLRYFAPQTDVAKAAEVESAVQDPQWVERLQTATNHADPATTDAPEAQAIEALRVTATHWVSRIRESSLQR
jgi:hypothetical protein